MIRRSCFVFFLVTCSLFGAGPATPSKVESHRIDPRSAYHRIFAIVPITGSGTRADPIRPAYAPLPRARGSRLSKPSPTGILGFNFVMSDNKTHALVEFVARDRAAFKDILADKRPDVKVFDKGKAKRSDIEAEFKKHKQNIDFDRFAVRVP
jgi:hypothetical protein